MKSNPLIFGLGFMLLLQPSVTAAETNKFVTKVTSEAVAECNKVFPDNVAETSQGFANEANFNDDGKPDYLFDYGATSCGPLFNCGSAGCLVTVYVSGKNGYIEAFSGNLQAWSIEKYDMRNSLKVGRKGGQSLLVWNGKKFVSKK
jgi:hypothetical protein